MHTVNSRNKTTLLTFDGTAQCNGFSGTLEVTPAAAHAPDQNVFINDIKMIDFSTGDGCPVSGEVTSKITLQGEDFTDDCTYTNLDVCGRQFSGQVVFSGENWDVSQSQLNAHTYDFDKTSKVQVDVVWQIDASILGGKALATIDGYALAIEVNQITFNDTCNLPIGGTLMINDSIGGITIADLTDNSCEKPKFSIEYKSATEVWTLTARTDNEEEIKPIVAGVKIIGKDEIVFDWDTDRCIEEDIPDSKASVFRDNAGNVRFSKTRLQYCNGFGF